MKFLFLFFFPLTVFSQTDKSELQKMNNEDQGSRMAKNIDWTVLSKQDKERKNRVYELIKSGQIVTGKDYINETQYFDNVSETAWNFYIGGYQPAQKWLKDKKERKLEFEDILHYQKVIVALT